MAVRAIIFSVILIALGANQLSRAGSPLDTVRAALAALGDNGIHVVAVSRFYRTPAWPNPNDPPFVNAVARVETDLSPVALIAVLHEIEDQFGRRRGVGNAPRTLDLDIVDYDGRVESPPDGPILPHPRAQDRPFVLAPLLDIAPAWVHPALGQSGLALLKAAETPENRAIPMG